MVVLKFFILKLLPFFTIIFFVTNVFSKTFHINPATGKISNDGSFANPWSTLKEIIDSGKIETQEGVSYPYVWGNPLRVKNSGAPVKAGDTLLLYSGYHGDVNILRAYNSDFITIIPASGQIPVLKRIRITAASKWKISGLTISPEFAPSYERVTLAFIESHNYSGPSRDIIFENCTLYSVKDASKWTKGQWDSLSCDGITVTGKKVLVKGNKLTNVNFGIAISADSSIAEKNFIINFAGDGLRGLGNYDEFLYNYVANCYAVNANHDDGFQSWSVGTGGVGTGVVKGIKLIGNTIINYLDPNQPFRGTLQGIGCFDGMFEDWVIENNVIMTDHWHGISLYGAINCRVINNTVCDLNNVSPGPPWIMITSHKDSTQSRNCIIRNNLSTSIINDGDATCVADHNIIIKNPNDFFIDYTNFDLHLKAGCIAIDSGSNELAPTTDITGAPRPYGTRVDVGAYEFGSSPVLQLKNKNVKTGKEVNVFYNKILSQLFIFANTNINSVTIYDVSGKKILETKPYKVNKYEINLNKTGSFSSLKVNMLFLKICCEKLVLYKKILLF
jgi:parallel beta-helix repeat protein